LTRQRDQLTAEIRSLPWIKIDKEYIFQTTDGNKTLAQLFDGRKQLLVYHFMFPPGVGNNGQVCPSCSFWADHFAGLHYHLPHRNVTFKVISRASIGELQSYKKRMGWVFDWVSSSISQFNYDMGVSTLGARESPGISIFYRDPQTDTVYHTYFTTARGLEVLNPTYNILDLVPLGRDEAGLKWPMEWVKRHYEYETTK